MPTEKRKILMPYNFDMRLRKAVRKVLYGKGKSKKVQMEQFRSGKREDT